MRLRVVSYLVSCVLLGVVTAQYDNRYSTTTPVPILKQINRHNEDGSYSYGYEAADGSYKIESKYPTGEVYGKYGFVDDSGSIREIEYGASKRGFEPSGTGINVPPSTLTRDNSIVESNEPDDDGQYREDPSIYYTNPKYTNGERYDSIPKIRRPHANAAPIAHNPHTIPRYPEYRQPQPSLKSHQDQRQPQEYIPHYRSQLETEYKTQYQSALPTIGPPRFQGQPTASNIDLNVGSYTVNYK